MGLLEEMGLLVDKKWGYLIGHLLNFLGRFMMLLVLYFSVYSCKIRKGSGE